MYISHFNHFTSTKKPAFNWLLQQMTQQTGNTGETKTSREPNTQSSKQGTTNSESPQD